MKKILLLVSLFSVVSISSSAQFTVVPDTNVIPLVNNFILSGVSASNVVFTGGEYSIGSFDNGYLTNLGMDDGIVMTTGTLFLSPYIGSPSSNFASTNLGEPGDPLLNSLLSGVVTYDATVLEFDLIPVGNWLEFQYVFASEEYPEYVFSSFNDIFGFFISGVNPGGGNYSNENIAIIPGTTLPVAINNVNATLNSSYFIDNQAIPGMTIVYDGFTTPLMAQLNVVPGSTYHLKMVIGDVSDGVFDSGIFLKAQSMKSYMITGIDEVQNSKLRISPNPISENSTLHFDVSNGEKIRVEIANSAGQIIFVEESRGNGGFYHLNISEVLSNYSNGFYLVKVITDTQSLIEKIIK